LASVKNQTTKEIDTALKAGVISIERDAKKNAPVYLSGIRRSIQHAKIGYLRYEVAANAYHAPYIEFGTRGKTNVPPELQDIARAVKARPKRGTFEQFVDALQEWIQKKGIAATQITTVKSGKRKGQFKKASKLSQAIYERQLAHLIAFRILKNGLRPQPFLYPAFLKNAKQIISDIRNILDEKSG
jgi:HK97 gp10 family phage protein